MSEHTNKNTAPAHTNEQKSSTPQTPTKPAAGSQQPQDPKLPRTDAEKGTDDHKSAPKSSGTTTTNDRGHAEAKDDRAGTEGKMAEAGKNQDGNRVGGDASRTVADKSATQGNKTATNNPKGNH